MKHDGYFRTWTYSSQEDIVRIVTQIRREGRQSFRCRRMDKHKEILAI